jgi:hypothetical protein
MRSFSRSTKDRPSRPRRALSRAHARWMVITAGVAGLALAVPGVAIASATTGAGAVSSAASSLPPNQCSMLMMWLKSIRLPNGGTAYSGYSTLGFKGSVQTPLDSVAIVIKQRFPAAAYGGWFIYPELYALPTGGVTYPNIKPDPGSVNPYTPGTPIFAPHRSYTVLMTADSVKQNQLPASLKNVRNRIFWPAGHNSFTMLGRSYVAKAGYDVGGTGGPLKISWADIRTYDLKTGKPIACGKVEPTRNLAQRASPWNTVGYDGLTGLPRPLRPLLPAPNADPTQQPPKPNPRLVEFFRLPSYGTGLPGGIVPPPIPDNCANYVVANLNQAQIAVIRVPKLPSYQPRNPAPNAVYKDTDAGAYVMQILGRLREYFRPGTPYTYTIANEDIKTDATGGATFVAWPRTLNPAQQLAVFAYARARGCNLLQGNFMSPGRYAYTMILRVNGPASTYTGGTYPTASRSGVPCMLGPQSVLNSYPQTRKLKALPYGTGFGTLGEQWAAVPSEMGSATPQGVECNFSGYVNGNCLRRLKAHIADTGGSYFAH